MPHSKAELAAVIERRTKLIRLRRQKPKVPFDSPDILALGYSSANVARKDFYRALEDRRKALDIEVTAFREEQNEIIDTLLETHIPPAVAGDIKSSELVLKLLERQSKLNGWEEALKAEVSGPGGGAVPFGPVTAAELERLIGTVGDGEDLPEASEDGDGDGDPDDD